MIGTERARQLRAREREEMCVQRWLVKQLESTGYDLSDWSCHFEVGRTVLVRGDKLVVEIAAVPKVGPFKDILFRLTVLLGRTELVSRPRVYNHIRLFHPNINVFTCELVFPEVVSEWNPALPLVHVLLGLRQTVVEPNVFMVPNTFLNRCAAYNYHANPRSYPKLIAAYHPHHTELKVAAHLDHHSLRGMDLEDEPGQGPEWWSVEELRRQPVEGEWSDEEEEEEVAMLSKQIKVMKVEEREAEAMCAQ